MLKKLMLASALVASSASAQQNTDISGPNFQSGKADAALADLGRKAAASGNKLVITAPPDWHAKIAAKVRAGGKADIVLRDGFYENVLVRVQDKTAASASAAEPAAATNADVARSKAEAARAMAEAERMRAEVEKAKAETEMARAEADKARAEADAATARVQAQQAAAIAAAKPAAPAPAQAASAPAGADIDAIRGRLEKTLNSGRSADGSLDVAKLRSGDTLYADGPVNAILRREGNRRLLFWLDGDLDLRRSELKPMGSNQYQVVSLVRGEGSLRQEFQQGGGALTASEPAADAPQRLALEKNLNDGRTVSGTITVASLRTGDIIYSDGDAAMVVRRQGKDMTRYWLTGSLNLAQTGVKADGANKYKVLSDTVQ